MVEEAKDIALAYLESHHVITIATLCSEGAWTSAVFYTNKGFNIYFLTESHTRHGYNLSKNSFVSGAIQEDYDNWEEIKGIQLLGNAVPLGKIEKSQVLKLFIQKYPPLKNFISVPQYAKIVAKAEAYRLTPKELWYLDNQRGFSSRARII